MIVADPLDPETEIGSLISSAQRDRVLGFLERASAAGGRCTEEDTSSTRPGSKLGTPFRQSSSPGLHRTRKSQAAKYSVR